MLAPNFQFAVLVLCTIVSAAAVLMAKGMVERILVTLLLTEIVTATWYSKPLGIEWLGSWSEPAWVSLIMYALGSLICWQADRADMQDVKRLEEKAKE